MVGGSPQRAVPRTNAMFGMFRLRAYYRCDHHEKGEGGGEGVVPGGSTPERRVIPFPGASETNGKSYKPMSPRAAEALLLDRVSAGSAVFVGTLERRGRRCQCYRLFNGDGEEAQAESTMVYQLYR